MSTFLLTFVVVALVVAAMAIGVIAGRKPIAGSCGGMGHLGLDCEGGCEKPCDKRLARMKAAAEAEARADASHAQQS